METFDAVYDDGCYPDCMNYVNYKQLASSDDVFAPLETCHPSPPTRSNAVEGLPGRLFVILLCRLSGAGKSGRARVPCLFAYPNASQIKRKKCIVPVSVSREYAISCIACRL